MRPHLSILLMLFLMINTAAQADVIPTSGKYYETTEDIKVKVMGGFLTLQRTWIDGQWHFNRHWNRLRIVRNLEDNSIKEIDRNGDIYVKADDAGKLFRFGKKETIAVTESGYRWQDRKGNWINFDSEGYFLKYGDRNNVAVTLQYDEHKRLSGVLDHFNEQMLWYSYNEQNQLVEIHDYTQRKVRYAYTGNKLTSVFDLRGNEWKYAYGGNNFTSKTDPENHTTQFSYNANNQLIKIEDELGVWREYGYDYDKTKDEFYFREKDGVGKVTESWYQKDGQLKQQAVNGNNAFGMRLDGINKIQSDSLGNETRYEYDEWGNVLNITYPDQSTKQYQYDAKYSNLIKEINENGVLTNYKYDKQGNLVQKIEAAGTNVERKTQYVYDEYGNQVSISRSETDAQDVFLLFYDFHGNQIKTVDFEKSERSAIYDVMGNILVKIDARGFKWKSTYNVMGNLEKEEDPLGNVKIYSYDKIGNLVDSTNAQGHTTYFVYDKRSHRVSKTDIEGKSYRWEYDGIGRLVNEVDEEGNNVRKYEYDAFGRLAKQIDGGGNAISYDYSDSNLPSRIIYPKHSEELKYDSRNRLVESSVLLENGSKVTTIHKYDPVNNQVSTVDGRGRIDYFSYDFLNRMIKKTDYLGFSTDFGYDSRDNLVFVSKGNGRVYKFNYDKNNRIVEEIRPLGQSNLFRYDEEGSLIEKIDSKKQITKSSYDAAGRKVLVAYFYPNSTEADHSINFSYNSLNYIESYTDGLASVFFLYDAIGRKIEEKINYGAFALSHHYGYFANGYKKSYVSPSGQFYNYEYDQSNKLEKIKLPNESEIYYKNYDWLMPGQVVYPGGSLREYIYDDLFRATKIVARDPLGNVIMDHVYKYDISNNVIEKNTEKGDYLYSYDLNNRLIELSHPVLSDEEYKYDGFENRLSDNTSQDSFLYNSNEELLQKDGKKFVYDLNGNVIEEWEGSNLKRKFFYGFRNQLTKIENENGGLIAEYYYDYSGRRLWKTTGANKTYYSYNDEGLQGEYDADGQSNIEYGYKPNEKWTSDPVFIKTEDSFNFYHNDNIGTPQKVTDANGFVIWEGVYKSFGDVSIIKSNITNPLRFSGQYHDQESDLYYNFNRHYDPSVGRYIQIDPYYFSMLNSHPYTYASNNPVSNIDPYGLCKWSGVITMWTVPYVNPNKLPEKVFGSKFLANLFLPTFGNATMFLESECCCKTKVTGAYDAVFVGGSIGALPASSTASKIIFDGPNCPHKDTPTGAFAASGFSSALVTGGAYLDVTSGDLRSKAKYILDKFSATDSQIGVDDGLLAVSGYTVGSGREDCCDESPKP